MKMILLVHLFLSLFSFPKKELKQFKIHGYAQGTDYSISYFSTDSIVTKGSIDSILLKIDSSMSLYKSYSLINRFNAGKAGLAVDMHFLNVIKKSFEIYRETDGRFDITVKPLVQAWGFGAKKIDKLPDSLQIAGLLKCVSMKNLSLKGNMLIKSQPCTQIDVNGIAQGYSVDVIADFLQQKGIKYYVAELGGELRVKGPKPDGTAMRIGIEGPAASANAEPQIKHIMAIKEGAVTTSGNYRKYIESGSKRLTHLIDPRSGYPINNEMISVTVYAKNAISADGYDNAIMAMGLDEGLRFVRSRKDLEVYIIYKQKDGKIADTMTAGFRKMIVE